MRALIADDQQDVIEALQLLLKQEGYQTYSVNSPAAVIESLAAGEFDLLLMDLNYTRDTTSGQEGLDLLARIRQLDRELPVLVMTAWGSVPLAVEAMRRGADDFVLKPWDNSELLDTIRRQLAEGAKTAAEERDAVETQKALLPQNIPQIPGCVIAVAWTPARIVGGDYLDVLPLGPERLGIAVGDVAGKGVPAALLMSNLQAAVRALAPEQPAARGLTKRLNRILCGNTASHKFVTFFYGVLDKCRLTYTNAGHNLPILVRADGTVERLDRGGTVLGVFPDCDYEQAEVYLAPGDRLVLFSDGVSEAENLRGAQFGEDRLAELVVSLRALDAAQLKEKIMSSVAAFVGGAWQDDATVIVLAMD
jgi:sigma-B regulation protein RsbU (phosphoserine phosphatase)